MDSLALLKTVFLIPTYRMPLLQYGVNQLKQTIVFMLYVLLTHLRENVSLKETPKVRQFVWKILSSPLLKNKPYCFSTTFSNIKKISETFLKHCQP